MVHCACVRVCPRTPPTVFILSPPNLAHWTLVYRLREWQARIFKNFFIFEVISKMAAGQKKIFGFRRNFFYTISFRFKECDFKKKFSKLPPTLSLCVFDFAFVCARTPPTVFGFFPPNLEHWTLVYISREWQARFFKKIFTFEVISKMAAGQKKNLQISAQFFLYNILPI